MLPNCIPCIFSTVLRWRLGGGFGGVKGRNKRSQFVSQKSTWNIWVQRLLFKGTGTKRVATGLRQDSLRKRQVKPACSVVPSTPPLRVLAPTSCPEDGFQVLLSTRSTRLPQLLKPCLLPKQILLDEGMCHKETFVLPTHPHTQTCSNSDNLEASLPQAWECAESSDNLNAEAGAGLATVSLKAGLRQVLMSSCVLSGSLLWKNKSSMAEVPLKV